MTQAGLLAVAALTVVSCGGDDEDVDPTPPPTLGTSASTSSEPVGSTDATPTTAAEIAFTSPDGTYAAVFPAEPTSDTREIPLDDGTKLPVTFYLAEVGGLAYGTAVVDYPAGSDVDLVGARDLAIASVNATVIESKPITRQGHDGLAFSADVAGQGTYIARFFAGEDRLYQVIVVGEGSVAETDPEVAAFLESFELLEDG